MNKRIVTIGLIQMRCPNSPDDNLTHIAKIDKQWKKEPRSSVCRNSS